MRLSGAGAMAVVEKIFLPGGKRVRLRSHRMYYGSIVDKGRCVDEVMLCCMLGPRSFTREDVAEIYAHGGPMTMRGVLDAALNNGARLALPGEFTKRAFLNGRLNLTQAEAVMDVIAAGSDAARAAGLRQLGGGLSGRVARCRDTILRWLAHIALSIDYPEHEEEAANRERILAEGQDLLADMEALLRTAEVGRVLREGVRTAIVGAPNAGKSTLLNAILGEDRAIVHALPGTTRDVLTEQVYLGDVPLVLMDTAGLRETEDPVERMGVARTRDVMRDAELVLYVVDGVEVGEETVGLCPTPRKLLEKLDQNYEGNRPGGDFPVDGQRVIVLVNKCDLLPEEEWERMLFTFREAAGGGLGVQRCDLRSDCGASPCIAMDEKMSVHADDNLRVDTVFSHRTRGEKAEPSEANTPLYPQPALPCIPISAKTGQGLDKLFAAIKGYFLYGLGDGGLGDFSETDVITRERHRGLLAEAVGHVEAALEDLGRGVAEDMVAIGLRSAYLSLGHILGLEYADDIVDRIFAEFCVGK
ncbi:MAG: tRNA uridine-5-carboxymethylaminomethyl(34) synthesis GTPase MnmE [Defluviitaleaceae bacterium]|nr:tRNA uridine-5-carboxymethylaminomethyl(34) synthesis GTPase MnmE [Defluviitaleaceae bacterium]MCL2204317.1 tRNA uridine-5-carboxymethylaminomethyl(34) synthesis GTPase MnmE [Defluviitaleaceae bacterium]MCL2240469.1 tRNA uridine-5-carboxymethylaminomethyl(34) synthesis GTPase MnmE [Defluviitaleaceae bacterium]